MNTMPFHSFQMWIVKALCGRPRCDGCLLLLEKPFDTIRPTNWRNWNSEIHTSHNQDFVPLTGPSVISHSMDQRSTYNIAWETNRERIFDLLQPSRRTSVSRGSSYGVEVLAPIVDKVANNNVPAIGGERPALIVSAPLVCPSMLGV
jgi:hypothetical protein